MEKMIRFVYAFSLFIFFQGYLNAQIITNRVIVANGGAYADPDDFVTLSAFDPNSGITETLASIFTQSVQGLFVHDGFAFVAAQDSLAKINIDEGTIEAIIALPGVNKFAVYQDKLLVSRQYPVTSDFVQIRSLHDLSLIASFPEISDESWEILVAGDTAYVSVAGGWAATTGKMAVLDVNTNTFIREINFGETAMGIGASFLEENNILFVCKTPWGGSSGTIIKYNILTCGYEQTQLPLVFGDAAGILSGKLFLVINQGIGMIDTETLTVINANLITNPFSNLEITGLTIDVVQGKIYVNYSWWIEPQGTGIIYDLEGVELGNYEVGISAEEVAIDYRFFMGNDLLNKIENAVYPNPCSDFLFIGHLPENAGLQMFDIYGNLTNELVSDGNPAFSMDVRNFSPGVYFLKIFENNPGYESEKVIHSKKIIITR